MSVDSRPDTPTASIAQSEFRLEARVTQLLKDNAALEKVRRLFHSVSSLTLSLFVLILTRC